MEITLWGVRGESPSASAESQYYGGDTACVDIVSASGPHLILDAGTGIARLGKTLPQQGEAHIFITGGSLDCWQGLPSFAPLCNPHWSLFLYFPDGAEDMTGLLFDGRLFALSREDVKATVTLRPLCPGMTVDVNGVSVCALTGEESRRGRMLNYRVSRDGKVFFYAGAANSNETLASGMEGAHVAVVSPPVTAGRTLAEQERWARERALEYGGVLLLSRHAPGETDAELGALRTVLESLPESRRVVSVAGQDLRVSAGTGELCWPVGEDWLRGVLDTLALYRDENVVLDHILLKSREICSAEAGTVYLLDGDELVFTYTHNDFLFPVNSANRHAYANVRMPISTNSMTGYVATTRTILNLPDVRQRPHGAPYKFDDSFDRKTGYKTVSALTVPIISRGGGLLGVLQLLNSMDRIGRPQPFSRLMERWVGVFAREAAVILENSRNVSWGIQRLLRIINLHDVAETGAHANRVGAVAAELYQQWAEKRGESPETIRYYKSQLRLAARLHDIGKVGVSDLVLKKEARLDDEERRVMAAHTWLGSTLFDRETRDISELATETALHHHQKWDGSGHSGHADVPALAGNDIPLAARITALADVFDCLVSPRGYKGTWTFEDAVTLVARQAGGHFDPELVERFLEIQDVVAAIYRRFPDDGA